jgi:hypothetical protein
MLSYLKAYSRIVVETVEVGDFGSLWEAITQTGPFDVCFYDDCVRAPGWGSWTALGLFSLELLFWIVTLRFGWRRLKGNKAPALTNDREAGPDSNPDGDGERSEGRCATSPFDR